MHRHQHAQPSAAATTDVVDVAVDRDGSGRSSASTTPPAEPQPSGWHEPGQLRRLLGGHEDRATVAALLSLVTDQPALLPPGPGVGADIDHDQVVGPPADAVKVKGYTIDQLRAGIAAAVAAIEDLPASHTADLAAARADLQRLGRYRHDHNLCLAAQHAGHPRRGLWRRWRPWRRPPPGTTDAHQAAERLGQRYQELAARVDLLAAGEAQRARALQAARPVVRHGVACAGELGARQEAAVEALTSQPPGYVVAELGDPPTNPALREVWQQGLYLIECFRADRGITDPDQPLGAVPPNRAAALPHQLASEQLAALRVELGRPGPANPDRAALLGLFDDP